MSKLSEVMAQIVSLLGTDSTLIGANYLTGTGRVSIRSGEQTRVIPGITLWLIDDARVQIDQDKEWTLRIQLDVWHTVWANASAILDRCDALLVDQVMTLTTYKVIAARREGAHQIETDEDVNGVMIKQLAAEYILRVKKTG